MTPPRPKVPGAKVPGYQQLPLPEQTYPCPTCAGKGYQEHADSGERRYCRVCQSTGIVEFDSTDTSVIPF